jgi:hypothetical protein
MTSTTWRRRGSLATAAVLALLTTACYFTAGPDTGQLDPTFGAGDGVVVFEGDAEASERFTAVAPLPDGDLLVAGETGDGIIAGRYDPDGTPDADHPPAPVLADRISGAHRVVDVAVDGSGAALLLVQHGDRWPVQTFGGGPFGWSIVKLRPDGTVDADFGDGGVSAAGPSSALPWSIGVRPDGTILVQEVEVVPPADPSVPVRFLDGLRTLSPAGDPAGRVALTTWVDTPPRQWAPRSMAIGPGGDAYVLSLGRLYRLDPAGTLTGPASPPVPVWATTNLLALALDGSGRIVATGRGSNLDGTPAEVIVRFDAALGADTTFGDAGVVRLPLDNHALPLLFHVHAADDGTVTWVLFTPMQESSVTIRRFTPTGAPDTSMSGDGLVRGGLRLGDAAVTTIAATVADDDVVIVGALASTGAAVAVRVNG